MFSLSTLEAYIIASKKVNDLKTKLFFNIFLLVQKYSNSSMFDFQSMFDDLQSGEDAAFVDELEAKCDEFFDHEDNTMYLNGVFKDTLLTTDDFKTFSEILQEFDKLKELINTKVRLSDEIKENLVI